MPVVITGTASAITSRAAPTVNAPASGDFPSDASNNQPDQGLLDLLASMLSHGALLDVANTFSQAQTYGTVAPGTATETVTGSIPTSGLARFLIKQWDGSAGKVRLYFLYLASGRMGVELTINAAWSNGGSNWTADVAGSASRWRLGQATASAVLPTIDTDIKTGLSAGGTWTESSFSWGAAAIVALTGLNGSFFGAGGAPFIAKRLPDGHVVWNYVFVPSTGIGAGSSICNALPAGWSNSTGSYLGTILDGTSFTLGATLLGGNSLVTHLALTSGRTYYGNMVYQPQN